MFDREIEECIEIAANPPEVWWRLTNFATYSEWNPFITHINGELREGARLSVTLNPASFPSFSIRPKLIVVEPERELRWRGRLGLPNLLDGEHAFLIETIGLDRVRFKQRGRFSGIFAPGAVEFIESRMRRSFRTMNEALRQRAEEVHVVNEVARAEQEARLNDP